jgi:hypothetical protein
VVTLNGNAVLNEDFEAPLDVEPAQPAQPVGGTPFTLVKLGSDPGPTILTEGEPPQGEDPVVAEGFLRVATEVPSQSGLVAFDKTADTTQNIRANFQLRGLDTGQVGRADGASFMLIDTAVYGDTGADQLPTVYTPFEEPNLAGRSAWASTRSTAMTARTAWMSPSRTSATTSRCTGTGSASRRSTSTARARPRQRDVQ